MKRKLQCSVASALGFALAGQAQAAGTTAGTNVTNSASVNYVVSGVSQPAVSSSVSFVVDRRINLAVAETGGAASTGAPGATDRVMAFTVSNSTNATQDFRLTATQDANNAVTAFTDTDNFDGTSVRVFVDVNNSGAYESATDTATYIDELAADTTKTVFIVMNVPAGQVDGDTAGVTLTAIAAASGTAATLGADMVETTVADTPGSVDTVFGDAAGDTDAARDGRHSDDDELDVASASVAVTKTSRVISDPHNGTTNPKAIPGATLEYCIKVANTGSTAAGSVTLADPIPANTTYAAGTLRTNDTVTAGVCGVDGSVEDDDAVGTDESDTMGASYATGTVSATLGTLAATTGVTSVRFRVTVN